MSKMSVSRFIEKSADGEQLIFDVVDENTTESTASDSSEAIAALEARVAALEAAVNTLTNSAEPAQG